MQTKRFLITLFFGLIYSPVVTADSNANPVIRELELLVANESAVFEEKDGWTIVNMQSENTVWFFALDNHSAAPAYIKRLAVEKNGAIYIESKVLCGASKADCDNLVMIFVDLDKKIKSELLISKD